MKLPAALSKLIDVVNHPGGYMRSEIERIKRNAQHKISEIIIKVIIFALMGLVGLMILIFASVTLGLWLNDVTDSSFMGFLIVTGFYCLLLSALLLIKDKEKITEKLFGFARRAVAVEIESPRMFEQMPKNGSSREVDKREEVYYH